MNAQHIKKIFKNITSADVKVDGKDVARVDRLFDQKNKKMIINFVSAITKDKAEVPSEPTMAGQV